MIVDLHAHYAMKLAETRRYAGDGPTQIDDLARLGAFGLLSALLNSPTCVTGDSLRRGGVNVVLSPLYLPFNEIDLALPYGAPPRDDYFDDLVALLKATEQAFQQELGADGVVARSFADVLQAQQAGRLALVHTIEGGYQMGRDPATIRGRVRQLAALGVASITPAHLFHRTVVANSPALPFLDDATYRVLCPQPQDPLSPSGEALLEQMVESKVLLDLTHMSRAAIDQVLTWLDGVDPGRTVPIVATHAACDIGNRHEYNLSDAHIRAIHARKGLVGLIACRHWTTPHLGAAGSSTSATVVLLDHIKHLHQVTGDYSAIGFGSDFDGFIRPSLSGWSSPMDYPALIAQLVAELGAQPMADITHGNAMRALAWWGSA